MLPATLNGKRSPDSYLLNYELMKEEDRQIVVYFTTQKHDRYVELKQDEVVLMLGRAFERLASPHLMGQERELLKQEYQQLRRCVGDFGPEIDAPARHVTSPLPDIVTHPALYACPVSPARAEKLAQQALQRYRLPARKGPQP